MENKHNGFSVIEMMVVVAIIAILAMIAIPSSMGRIVKEQVLAAMPLADIAKEPIAAAWKATKTLPVNNKEAGLPVPEKVVSNFVSPPERRRHRGARAARRLQPPHPEPRPERRPRHSGRQRRHAFHHPARHLPVHGHRELSATLPPRIKNAAPANKWLRARLCCWRYGTTGLVAVTNASIRPGHIHP